MARTISSPPAASASWAEGGTDGPSPVSSTVCGERARRRKLSVRARWRIVNSQARMFVPGW